MWNLINLENNDLGVKLLIFNGNRNIDVLLVRIFKLDIDIILRMLI